MKPGRLAVPLLALLLSVILPESQGSPFDARVPLHQKGTATYYVNGYINGHMASEFMVDTGSGYVIINPQTLKTLRRQGKVSFVKKLAAVLADGKEKVVSVYRLSSLEVGNGCTLYDVEAAVIPGSSRNILGMSALRKAAPFAISVSPPALMLTNCTLRDAAVSTFPRDPQG